MGTIICSVIFGLICVIAGILYFFRSKASVAVGWILLGVIGATIGSCVGFAEMGKKIAADAKEFKKEWDKSIDEASKKFDQEIEKFRQEIKQGPKKNQ